MNIKIKMATQRKKSIKNQDELPSKIGKTRLKLADSIKVIS